MLKEKAFLQSKIIMAETDSIYLTINLTDSTAKSGNQRCSCSYNKDEQGKNK